MGNNSLEDSVLFSPFLNRIDICTVKEMEVGGQARTWWKKLRETEMSQAISIRLMCVEVGISQIKRKHKIPIHILLVLILKYPISQVLVNSYVN